MKNQAEQRREDRRGRKASCVWLPEDFHREFKKLLVDKGETFQTWCERQMKREMQKAN